MKTMKKGCKWVLRIVMILELSDSVTKSIIQQDIRKLSMR